MIRRLLLSALLALLCMSSAEAQSVLLQSGAITPGHAPMYVNSGNGQPVVQDSGTAAGGATGIGLSEMGLTARGTGTPPYAGQGKGLYGTNWCDYDAPVTNATGYHYFCLSPNAQGGGLMAFGAGGVATALPFNFIINGSTYSFPFTVGGIVGPNSSAVGDLACWNNTIGTLLADCAVVGLAHGGTGQTTANAALNALLPTQGASAGQYLQTNGTNASWSTIAWASIVQANQAANAVFVGPTTGAAATPTFRALVGADLPNPGASSLGGIESYAAVTHQFLTTISTSGVPSSAQPAFTDISGTAQIAQGGTSVTTAADYPAGQLQRNTSTQVCLKPFKGNLVAFPSGTITTIPSGGTCSTITSASLNGTAGQTLSASTLYYGYLWFNGAAYVIDWSTTGHTTDTTTGIEIKSGDATRVLVGMIYPQSGPVVTDTAAARLVATWKNRIPHQLRNVFTTDRSTASATYVEVNSEIRCLFLTWGDNVQMNYSGSAYATTGTINILGGPSVDSATTAFPSTQINATNAGQSIATSGVAAPAEGEHYMTEMGEVGSGTGNWATTAQQGSLSGLVVN